MIRNWPAVPTFIHRATKVSTEVQLQLSRIVVVPPVRPDRLHPKQPVIVQERAVAGEATLDLGHPWLPVPCLAEKR